MTKPDVSRLDQDLSTFYDRLALYKMHKESPRLLDAAPFRLDQNSPRVASEPHFL